MVKPSLCIYVKPWDRMDKVDIMTKLLYLIRISLSHQFSYQFCVCESDLCKYYSGEVHLIRKALGARLCFQL